MIHKYDMIASIMDGGVRKRRNEEVRPGDGVFIDIMNGYCVFMMYASCDSGLFDVVKEYAAGLVVVSVLPNCDNFEYIRFAFNHLSVLVHVPLEYDGNVQSFLISVDEICDFVGIEIDDLARLESRFRVTFRKSLLDPVMPLIDERLFNWQRNNMKILMKKRENEFLDEMFRWEGRVFDCNDLCLFDLVASLFYVSMSFMIRSKFYAFCNDVKYLDALKEGKEEDSVQFEMADFAEMTLRKAGSYGTVNACYHVVHHQIFAVKIDNQNDVSRTEREFKIMRRCRHPCIIHAYAMVVVPCQKCGIIMEYAIYGSLQSLQGNVYVTDTSPGCWGFPIIVDVCFGIDHMHACGFVHRDIKYDNIVISHSGRANLCDFGSACPIGRGNEGIEENVTKAYQAEETREDGVFTLFSDYYFIDNLFVERYRAIPATSQIAGMVNGRKERAIARPMAIYLVYMLMWDHMRCPYLNPALMRRIVELFKIRKPFSERSDYAVFMSYLMDMNDFESGIHFSGGEYLTCFLPFYMEREGMDHWMERPDTRLSKKVFVEALLSMLNGVKTDIDFDISMKIRATNFGECSSESEILRWMIFRLCGQMLADKDKTLRKWAMQQIRTLIELGYDEGCLYIAMELMFIGKREKALEYLEKFFGNDFDVEKLIRTRIPDANIPIEAHLYSKRILEVLDEPLCGLFLFDELVRIYYFRGTEYRLPTNLKVFNEDKFCDGAVQMFQSYMSGRPYDNLWTPERYCFKWVRYIVSLIIGGRIIGTERTLAIADYLHQAVRELIDIGESWDALKCSSCFSTDDVMWFRWLKHEATLMNLI